MKKVTEQPRISTIDFLIGFVLAIAISDWFIQPYFDTTGKTYAAKLALWVLSTIVFLIIGLFLMLLSMYIRARIKQLRHKK